MIRNLIVILLLVATISCTDKKNDAKIQKIDSLITIVDSLNNALLRVNIDSINQIFNNTSDAISIFRKTNSNCCRAKILQNMEYASTINKSCGKYIGKYTSFQKELSYSSHQLQNLRKDTENKQLNDSIFYEYYSVEKSIIQKIHTDFTISKDWVYKQMELYEIAKEDINSIKDTLLSLQKTQ